MRNFAEQIFWHNSLQDWITVFCLCALLLIVVRLFRTIAMSRMKKLFVRTRPIWDDFLLAQVDRSVVPIAYMAAIYFPLGMLTLPAGFVRALYVAVISVATYYVLRLVTSFMKEFIFSFIKTRENGEAKEKQAKGLVVILNVAVWIMGAIFLIDNFGYDVTTLVAGLGIGGIAIALAAQAVLGDLFSYFVIFFDKPFEIGDFIIIDDKMGVVEYVGVKTTRLRTLNGEQLVCSNTDLTNSRLHNYKRMDRRRVVFRLGVVYQTSHRQLQAIPGMVKQIIESKEDVSFDRGHFCAFGSSSLDFEFVFYVNSPDYNFYMDKQQAIFFDIAGLFEAEGIGFAYPTQTLFLESIKENS